MSRLYYFASDTPLKEQPNPYVKMLSINQALAQGIKVNSMLLDSGIDFDKPNVILFCEDEEKISYPNFFLINKDDYYDDIGTKKSFCVAMNWDYEEDTAIEVLRYIQNQMKTSVKLEVWSVWLGSDEINSGTEVIHKEYCKLDELCIEILRDFYKDRYDYQCLIVSR